LGAAVALGWFVGQAFEEVPAHAAGGPEQGQGSVTVSGNGDVNGDNGLDLSDAIYLLTHLFQGGPAPLPCPGGGGNCTAVEAALATCQADLLACTGGVQEICNNGVDDDVDCDIDCADSDCAADIDCTTVTPTFTFIGTNATTGLEEYREDETLIEFVLLPGGMFDMGSPGTEDNHEGNEGPVHNVPLASFLISETEVTQAQYLAVMGSNPSEFSDNVQRPVERVSWDDLNKAGGFLQKTGLRLPTEAEWEYAARGGTSTAFSFGDDCNAFLFEPCDPADDFMVFGGNDNMIAEPGRPNSTELVGQKLPNDFGLFDMHGNVWEWCQDLHDDLFYGTPEATEPNPVSTSGFENRTARGGGWVDRASDCRSAYRRAGIKQDERGRDHAVGFRVAAPAP